MALRRAVLLGLLTFVPLATSQADVFDDYESFDEGFLGTSFAHAGVQYVEANHVDGVFPDGSTFTAADLGDQFIIERAVPLFDQFPAYGSPNNALTFGQAFINGDNLSIGPMASIWIELDEPGTAASMDLAYYENGPWGGIVIRLDAYDGAAVVASDSFTISDLGGRDNPAATSLSLSADSFDRLHLYATFGSDFSAPRGIIDDLSITAVPEPAGVLLLSIAVLSVLRRR